MTKTIRIVKKNFESLDNRASAAVHARRQSLRASRPAPVDGEDEPKPSAGSTAGLARRLHASVRRLVAGLWYRAPVARGLESMMTRLAFALALIGPSWCPSASAWESDKNARPRQELSGRHFNGVAFVAEGDRYEQTEELGGAPWVVRDEEIFWESQGFRWR